MTSTTNPLDDTAPADAAATSADPFQTAVDALTEAALTTRKGHPLDVAGFVAVVLAAVTANVGSLDRLLAGRPGSWEASLVGQLVEGTVGHDPVQLWRHRTAPVVVTVHVAELVEERFGLPGVPEARDRFDAALAADPDADAEAAIDALDSDWHDAYRAYGHAFTQAVRAKAATLDTLTAPVTVQVIDHPDAKWWGPDPGPLNPREHDDPLVLALWQHAITTISLPVDERGNLIRPTDPTGAA